MGGGGKGQNFCRWNHKFAAFRRTRIAYLYQQVRANLKKKDHRANLAYFSPSFRLISKNKNPPSSNCRKEKGSLGGRSFCLGGALLSLVPSLIAALAQ